MPVPLLRDLDRVDASLAIACKHCPSGWAILILGMEAFLTYGEDLDSTNGQNESLIHFDTMQVGMSFGL